MLANHSHAIQPQSWYPPIVMLHNPSCYATIFMLLRHVMLSNQSCYSMTIMLPKQVMLSKHHHDIQMCHVIHRSCCLTTISHVTQLPSCYLTTVMLCKPIMPSNHDHATKTCHTIHPLSFYANKSCFPTSIILLKHVMLSNHRHVMQPIMLPDHHHATQTSHAIPPPTCHPAVCDLWVTNCRCLEGMLPVIGWSVVPTSRSLDRRMRLSVSWREWRYVRYLCVGLLSCCHCAD